MRVIESEDQLAQSLEMAQREAKNAFGSDEVFVEKLVGKARHIEVQILGDQHGNIIHLHERDLFCATSPPKGRRNCTCTTLGPEGPSSIARSSVGNRKSGWYYCAGTVEFLLDTDTTSSISSKSIHASKWSIR